MVRKTEEETGEPLGKSEKISKGKKVVDEQNEPELRERHYVGPKRQEKVAAQIFMGRDVRLKVRGLARTEDKGGQEFVEELLTKLVRENPERVEQGKKLLKRTDIKHPYRTKVQVLEEENAKLKEQLESGKKSGFDR